jgi:serine/threonine protein kinase/tetratricopeptide (TPR) repeat protein
MAPADCPNRETLAALAAGLLSGEALTAVAAHLDGCPACLAVAQSANTDTDRLVAALCQPDPADPYAREEGCDRAQARLLATYRDDVAPDLPTLIAPGHRPPGPPEVTAGSPPGGVSTGESVGTLVAGRYKLLEKIGEGGMGAVWAAEQTQPVRRKVAIKLVKAGMDSRTVLARFDAERQALALMDHPNIAKVLDGGTTETGRPFFVMEYVPGAPFTRYCDDARLSIAERLALFVPVCQAVQHAHAKGVIHRDLKPSNILVGVYDGHPVPKVIDFGLAKAVHQPLTEHSLHTAPGAMLGTLLYISPEQAAFNNSDVDTRTDVYALGVVLYELLTGTTPLERERFREAAWHEMLRLIKEEEPPRPSDRLSGSDALPSLAAQRQLEPARLTRLVRGELDWIVMKCLEKDRSRRYETANGLARDVERYLADESVEACPPSASYRLKKVIRRNKGPVLAALMIFLLLVGGVIGTTWGMIRANIARKAEFERAEGERKANARAEKRSEQLERATEVLTSAFRDLDPNTEEAQDKPLRLIIGDRLAEIADQLEGEGVGDPVVGAGLQYRLGFTLLRLGQSEKAIPLLEKAKATRTATLGPNDAKTLNAVSALAESFHQAGKLDQATKLHEETLARRKATFGPEHPDTLFSMNNLAAVYKAEGRLDEALPILEEALRLRKAKLGPDDPDTLQSMNNMAVTYLASGKLDLALPLWEETLELRRRKLGPEHPNTLSSMNNLATGYGRAGKPDLAVPLLEEALRLRRAKLGVDHPDTLMTRNNLALAYKATGKKDLVLPLLEENLKLYRAKLGPGHPYALLSLNSLGTACRDFGDHDRALSLFQELATGLEKMDFRHEHAPIFLDNLGDALEHSKQFSGAEKWRRKSAELVKERSGADSVAYAGGLAMLGANLLQQEKWTDAEPVLRESLAFHEKKEPGAWATHSTRSLLGGALLGQKKYAEAEPLLVQGYEGMKAREVQIPPPARYRVAESGERIVRLYDAWGRAEKAAEWRTKLAGTGEGKPKP